MEERLEHIKNLITSNGADLQTATVSWCDRLDNIGKEQERVGYNSAIANALDIVLTSNSPDKYELYSKIMALYKKETFL